ncbi:MAG: hypothetical protein IPQ14_04390 [Candidatus Microthrix sp.]|uniref:hypothetical protein n=1 Tax=Candidatus Neomicrothrix sp. TaxID=2719034 RepID=UPI0025C4AE63|nr:hypothetical protein [Candidatus Microthrix sp.]MBL0203570.1 hypothetical protein [Candidatus Microthrix sp.]
MAENVVTISGKLAEDEWNDVLADEARGWERRWRWAWSSVDAKHFANFSIVYGPDGTVALNAAGSVMTRSGVYRSASTCRFDRSSNRFGHRSAGSLLPRDQLPGTGLAVLDLPLASGETVKGRRGDQLGDLLPRRVLRSVAAGGG